MLLYTAYTILQPDIRKENHYSVWHLRTIKIIDPRHKLIASIRLPVTPPRSNDICKVIALHRPLPVDHQLKIKNEILISHAFARLRR